jgi:hypothetical protein
MTVYYNVLENILGILHAENPAATTISLVGSSEKGKC